MSLPTITQIRAFIDRPIGRYLVIGGSVYVIELIIIIGLQKSGMDATPAVGIAFLSGLALSFLLQKMVTFNDRRLHHRILLPQVTAYSLLVIFNFSFTLLLTEMLSAVIPATVIRTIALAITTIWNFYLYKTRIFNRP